MTHEGGFTNTQASWFKAFFAHELAHYYFGTYKRFNSELGDMFTESFAEYLSIKTTKDLLGTDAYLDRVKHKLNELEGVELVGISNIKSSSDYGDRELYVYVYAPIIWLAVEKEIGSKKMWLWLNKILMDKSIRTDYDFVLKTLSETLNDDEKLNILTEKYFKSSKTIESLNILLNND